MDFFGFGIIDFNPPERMRAFISGSIARKLDEFIGKNISILGDFSFSNHLVEGIVFHLGHKIDALGDPLGKEPVVIVGPVIDHNGAWRKSNLPGDLDVGHLAFCNSGKGRKVAVMVQKEV